MVSTKRDGWLQAIAVILAVVTASVSVAMAFETRMAGVESELAALNRRMNEGGWSFRQHTLWVETLRDSAEHPVPSPAKFPPPSSHK